ncbi:MAG: DUF192 domain-containing protein [Chloroflexi bacterium]|nr:DUF192 domain-containing protein [Chloroflexota bacterium]
MAGRPGLRIVNRSRGVVIADQVEVAMSVWARARGLIGRRSLPIGFGLVIKPCGAIHMWFMAIPLDVAHVDRTGRIVKILHGIKPWRVGPLVPRSRWVIELPAGTAQATGTQVGDVIDVVEDEASRPDVGTPRGRST